MFRKSLIRLQVRNNLASIVSFLVLGLVLANMDEFFQLAYLGGLVLAYNIHSYYRLMLGQDKYLLRLSPLDPREIYRNFCLASLILGLAFVLVGYLINIKYFGSGPYNLFLSLRNFIVILNIGCLSLGLNSGFYLLDKFLARRSPSYKRGRLVNLLILAFILVGNFPPLNKILGKYSLGLIRSYQKLAVRISGLGLISSSTLTSLDPAKIRPERLEVMEKSMFYIGNKMVVLNLGLVLINILLILGLAYASYKIYLKTMER